MSKSIPVLACLAATVLFGLAACNPSHRQSDKVEDNRLKVVATTTIVGDVVRNIAGEAIEQFTLLPPGADPHSFEPSPQDAARLEDTSLVFINGAGLEAFLEPLLQNVSSQARVVDLSKEISLLEAGPDVHTAGEHASEMRGDPHVWFDPYSVLAWVDQIESALSEADPANAAIYHANAEKYRQELVELDEWIGEQVNRIPPDRRRLVTDHLSFTYFADRYGFEQVGALIPGYSTLAQPSAQELAMLEDAIRNLAVNTIFLGNTVNPSLAERVTADTGAKLVQVFTGSLTASDGPASSYLDYMRYNVSAIVNALR
jgi:ABC-type Zn uptake system ZnuABC Zn-binding protein ZnuA